MRRVAGALLGWFIRAWLMTCRVTTHVAPELAAAGGVPWVLAFFHGSQMGLLAWPRRTKVSVLVSLSRDGELQSGVLGALGLHVVRGSSSKRGVAGLLELVRLAVRGGGDLAFAVDGPRGPFGVPKPGAGASAKRLGGELVPLGMAATREHVLRRSWDRFRIVWPFSRISVVLGPPIRHDAPPEQLAQAITRAEMDARERLLA